MGKIVRAIAENGGVIVAAVDATDIVSEAERLHSTAATASAALGRLLTGAALMGVMLKGEDDSVTVRMNGGGPIGNVVAVADSKGHVKGYCDNPLVDLPLNEKGKLDVSGAIGKDGMLYVISDLGLKEPYVGQVPITSGEIAEDITYYYAISQQTPTVCALGVLVNPDLSISRAGGFLLQLLPGALDSEIDMIERNIAGMSSVTSLMAGHTIEEIAFMALEGFEPQILDESEVKYHCPCTRERMEKVLISLGKEELDDILKDNEDTEIVCNFCSKKYVFSPDDLKTLCENAK